ncbi:DUF2142 domain-containing protein [Oribacterium sp. WCC10]|uniref:DUF2142 domain-containing protein n=1 Tax=Oribacterium sp. WCC10 TaxID=1855343 RepID=UPI0008E0F046|nr:DUF2142 domain-containing protein [Oribacterium sp. WCC10]SFG40027.1 Uncharacterized membrane protein [Oribacterium sp. WCC10]
MLQILNGLQGTEDRFLIEWFILLLIGLLVLFTAVIFLLFRSKLKLHQIYFVTVFWMGLMFMTVLPPLSAPDEVLHFVGAYELSDKLMLTQSRDSDGNVIIRKEDEFIVDWPGDDDWNRATVLGQTLDRSVYREIHRYGLFTSRENGDGITLQQPVATTPIAYLMPALGITLARVLNFGAIGLLYAGRLMNLLMFSILGSMAVRRTPVGKKIFFAVSLFPMTLELAGSYSYDSFIIALGFYLTAVILSHAMKSKETKIGIGDIVEMGVLAVLLSPCKMIYATLFALCLMIPVSRWKKPSVLRWGVTVLIIGALIVGSIVLVNLREVLRYVNVSGVTNAPELTSSGEVNTVKLHDLQELIKDKTLIIRIIRNTFQILGKEYLGTTVGMWLGAFDRGLTTGSELIAGFWSIALIEALLGRDDCRAPEWWKRVLMAVVSVLLSFVLFTSMLLSYTPADTFYILGVQGRYFLPYLPVILMTLRSERLDRITAKTGWTEPFTRILLAFELAMSGMVITGCFLTVVSRSV